MWTRIAESIMVRSAEVRMGISICKVEHHRTKLLSAILVHTFRFVFDEKVQRKAEAADVLVRMPTPRMPTPSQQPSLSFP